jgi:hypothetical protein
MKSICSWSDPLTTLLLAQGVKWPLSNFLLLPFMSHYMRHLLNTVHVNSKLQKRQKIDHVPGMPVVCFGTPQIPWAASSVTWALDFLWKIQKQKCVNIKPCYTECVWMKIWKCVMACIVWFNLHDGHHHDKLCVVHIIQRGKQKKKPLNIFGFEHLISGQQRDLVHIQNDNIKIDLWETVYEDMKWIMYLKFKRWEQIKIKKESLLVS